MKNIYFNSKLNNRSCYFFLQLFFLFGTIVTVNAQLRVPFTQRTSQYTPNKKIYNVKGDFTMIGNTNLTLQNYGDQTTNGNIAMQYVDIDGNSNNGVDAKPTFNSSSSTLTFSSENGATPSCSNIVYAGLYWTGRASNASTSDNTFTVTKTLPGSQLINNDYTLGNGSTITNTTYALAITREDVSRSNRYPIYTFSDGTNNYVFNYTNATGASMITLSVNGGTAVNVPATVSTSGSTATATLTTPYTITNGTVTITIKNLVRSTATNLSSGDTRSTSFSNVNVFGTDNVTISKTFDKRIISLKGPGATSYTQFTASANDIYYPTTTDGYMYSAYKEVTDYVRANGIGTYTAADIALVEGDGGDTGYYGGWSLIVVYENSKMKYRDVTIFDGHAYVSGGVTADFEIPVSGFNTVQTGSVGIKLGLMAGEGDRNISGDKFQILKQSDNTFLDLNHSGNTTGNFFNSSIQTGGNARNPNLLNNTGLDISMFNIPNTSNSIITNNQTSTRFKYSSTQDTFVIFAIAMSIDAFVPEVEGVITTTTINGSPATLPYTILPNQEAGFSVDIKNIGTEPINNYKLIIPIPYNASYVPGSAVGTIFSPQTTPTPNNISFNPSLGVTGSLVWDFGTLVLPPNPNTILAKLNFKLTATSNCSILNNASCTGLIAVNGYSTGVSGITSVNLNNTPLIQGFTNIGSCLGEPIPAPIYLTIDGSSYVSQNCSGDNILRNFTYCSEATTVGTSNIASNFPPGSLFFNEFPVTINSIQYSDNNPIPLIAGSTITYYAVPAGGGNGCNFPFTISKCPAIVAKDDTIGGGNGTTGNSNIGNILTDNGNGNDTVNGNPATINQVNISIVTPATPIGGNPVPLINTFNGQVSVPPGTPAGTYTIVYQICDINNISNCDSAIVTITVNRPIIDAVNDNGTSIVGASGGQSVANVLVNDTLNGNQATLSNVILTQVSTTNPSVTLDPLTGAVNVAPGTAAGNYTVTYQICEIINPTNCDTATVSVSVSAAAIVANDDNYLTQCSNLGSIGNILNNDSLNSTTGLSTNEVNLTILSGSYNNLTIDASGNVNLLSSGSCGTYTFTYRICEILNPNNCDEATVTVVIQDLIAPVVPQAPATANVACASEVPAMISLTANDNCSGEITAQGV
ncbi:beta strand repeat-containing protein, partial [Flavobacterium sp.]|uniref:beta strand repeat-containing protein n=1 Tax=Flavobacterium sp. TaxID=239 RepID=UPI0037BED087